MGVRSWGFYQRLNEGLTSYIQDFAKYDLDNGDGDTRRDRLRRSNQTRPENVPQPLPIPEGGAQYISWLWELRGFCADASEPIKPDLLRGWSSDMGISLNRAEKGIIYAMDKAFRTQYPKTVAYYAEVKARSKKGA